MANRAVMWRAGSASLLDGTQLVLRQKPKASPGHVVVRFTTRVVYVEEFLPLEFRDFSGMCGEKVVVGFEGCALVEEIGEGVSKVQKLGVRVIPFLSTDLHEQGEGSWQDYVEVPEEDLLVVPDTLATEVAAQLLNCWTAYALLKDLNLPKGEYLLQTAAGSTIGRLVIRLARHWGLRTINVVRRDEVKQELKDLGADEVINFTTEDLVTRVKEITGGRGAYVGVDYVGGPISKAVPSCVRDGGQSLVLGCLESKDSTISFMDLCRGIELKGWNTYHHFNDKNKRDKEAVEVTKLFEENVFETRAISKRFPLENFKESILEVQCDRGRHGMVLLIS